jgi:hypothetical protein
VQWYENSGAGITSAVDLRRRFILKDKSTIVTGSINGIDLGVAAAIAALSLNDGWVAA